MKFEYPRKTINGKFQMIHRAVMEERIGRPLKPDEVVHHINGDKSDFSEDNLELMKWSAHSKLHTEGTAKKEYITCACCGELVEKRTNDIEKYRKKGIVDFYCNKSCASKHRARMKGMPAPLKKYNCDIDNIVKAGLDKGLSGYSIAKENGLNRKTVYNHINKIQSADVV